MKNEIKNEELRLEAGTYETRLTKKFTLRKPYEKPNPKVIKAVIPGAIAELHAAVGKHVKSGEVLIVLEAMKMRNLIKAPQEGRIKALHVASGDKVVKGQVLIEME